ncbi:MAG: toxin-antitoxin system, toxin component, PIN family protein [Ferrovum sp.]|nr:toxin-antitoxin system, toxin component, PIN family protein [Ferrovum sp.]
MIDPFFFDECLALELVAEANARGHHATHVVFRELQGTLDSDLLSLVTNENFVFVTNNRRDFLKLYASLDFHPGLVIIVPGSTPPRLQVELFDRVLNVIEPMDDIINKIVEVFSDGSVQIRDYPEQIKPPIP